MTDLTYEELIKKEIDIYDREDVLKNYHLYDKRLKTIKQSIISHEKEIKKLKIYHERIMKDKVKFLFKLNQPEQLSKEWFEMRKHMLTASDIGAILGYSKYDSRKKIIRKKCGLGKPFRGNKYTFHGQKYEEIAKQLYELRYDLKVDEFGLIQHPSIDILGASPDGISTTGIMLEIKCPSMRKITGIIPDHYWVQMQTQLQVCQLDVCDFVECKITEYASEEDYKDDEFEIEDYEYLDIIPQIFDIDHIKVPHDRRNYLGLEKGIIGEIRIYENDEWKSKYFYPPFELNSEEQLEWLDEKSSEIKKYITEIYWKLEFSSVVRVKRDDEWWIKTDVEEKLNTVWEEILQHREDLKDGFGLEVDFSQLKIELPDTEFYKNLPVISEDERDDFEIEDCLFSDNEEDKQIKSEINECLFSDSE
jgi:putative phage-type endonuclease